MANYKKGQVWNKAKTQLMLDFESKTNKSAVFRGKITGQFEYWLWQQQKLSSTKKHKLKTEMFSGSLKKSLKEIGSLKKSPKIELEYYGVTVSGGESKKFYKIYRIKNTIYINYGRIGTNGRVSQTTFNTIEQAEKQMNKIVNSKLAKGYREVTKKKLESSKRQVTTPTSKRIHPMLAGQGRHLLGNPDYILQQKYDGTRCIIIKKNNVIKMISRSWKSDYSSNYPEIVNDIKKIPITSFILDSELTFFKGKKDVFLTALATEESKKGYIAKCMIFDILEYKGMNVRDSTLEYRNKLLLEIIPDSLKYLKVVKSYNRNHKKIFNDIISDKRQGEGVVLKRLDSLYKEGGRTKDWIKVKGWKSDEAIVVGVTYGTGARLATFGSLILAQYDNGKLKYVGKTSGFKELEQKQLIETMKHFITEKSQLVEIPDKYVKYWTKPKIVIEVKYQEKTKDGKFRFPSFMRFRHDKSPKECIFKK